MKLVDANVLLHAINESAPRHEDARDWLDGALGGRTTIGFTWVVLLAFVRLSTKPGLFPRPFSVTTAGECVRVWLAAPAATVLEPTARHLDLLSGLLAASGTGGNLTNDAHLAALALEHRGEVITYDADFGRFPGVAWRRPSAS